jgi:hypothetical protein
MSETETEEMLNLPKREFIKRCKQYIDEERDGKLFKVDDPGKCPLAIWVAHNDAKCHREMVPNTEVCPLCGNPVCPDCMNHVVETLSRVTGYLSTVSSWGAAKRQEFKDRNRYDL